MHLDFPQNLIIHTPFYSFPSFKNYQKKKKKKANLKNLGVVSTPTIISPTHELCSPISKNNELEKIEEIE